MQTILVIDDDESWHDTIGVLLERENFNAILEADGRSGFEEAVGEAESDSGGSNNAFVFQETLEPQSTPPV